MRKKTKRIPDKNNYGKTSFKDTKDKNRKKIVSSKISKFANGFRIPDDIKDAKLNRSKMLFRYDVTSIFTLYVLEFIIII
jgi:hypothetical protein